MQQSQRNFLADDTLPNDELDDLFKKLHQITPPESLIKRILFTVSLLPRPGLPVPPEVIETTDTLHGPIIQKDKLPPS